MKRAQLYLSTIDPKAGDIARANGVGIEIAEFCTAVNADTLFEAANEKVLSQIRGVPRRVLHGAFNELFPCAIDPLARELAAYRYTQALELSGRYGAGKLVLHGGYSPKLYYPCWYVEQSVVFWRKFLKNHPEEFEICLENVMEEEPDMLLSIVRQVDDPRLTLCLDVGHVNHYSGVPAMEWMEQYGGHLSHLHLHNNDASADTHSALPCGSLPMADLIRHIGASMTATLELIEIGDSIPWLTENGLLESGILSSPEDLKQTGEQYEL